MPSSRKPALPPAYDYCRWLTRRSRSNFVTAIRLLSPPQRQAMEAVYAFCRAVDDVVDLDGSEERARSQLQLWRQELNRCQDGFPTHPIALALQPAIARYQIPIAYFHSLIEGVEMDLSTKRYARFEELKVYCRHVASMVGFISIRIFGCRNPAAEKYADSLGMALQLTNILRDLKTDFERGRVYLPLEEMNRFRFSEKELAGGRRSDSFQRLMAFQCERARSFFDEARIALKESGEARLLLPARIMGGVYARLLTRIEELQYDVFSRRISVPAREQLWIAARCLLS